MDSKEKAYWAFLKLSCYFGKQGWWPRMWMSKDFKDEVILGAILTQNVGWKSVERVLKSLNDMGILGLDELLELDDEVLLEILKPIAFRRRKIKTLRNVYKIVKKRVPARNELLEVYGIGEETADVILLYAYGFSMFIVDEYTRRWFKRFFGFKENDENIRNALYFDEIFYLKEMHALIDNLGKVFCKKKPLCNLCPLKKLCYRL